MPGPAPGNAALDCLKPVARIVGQESCGDEGWNSKQTQQVLWQQFFSDPTKWCDNRRTKPTPHHPDFTHKESKSALWVHNRQKPVWVDSQLARLEAAWKRSSQPVPTSVNKGQGDFAGHDGGHTGLQMCRKLCDDGRISDAVNALDRLVQQGRHVPSSLYYHLLKRCIAIKDLVLGRQIHALSVESGYEGDDFLATHFIGLYASHGRLDAGMGVFVKISTPSLYSWSSIIFAYARHGEGAQVIQLYRQMRQSAVEPDNRVYSAVLKACASTGDILAGKEVHSDIVASPRKPDIFVHAGLLDMYAKCGHIEDAREVFDGLPERDVVAWNTLLAGYARRGMGQQALELYSSMQEEGLCAPSCATFVCLLQACAGIGVEALHEGKQMHAQIEEQGLEVDVVLGGSLVNMYAKCGSPGDARIVFDGLRDRDVVTWTVMIAGYAQKGMGQEALNLYSSMREDGLVPPDSVTFMCLLQACASVGAGALRQGKQLHAHIEERGLQDDVVIGGSLVNMYAKCGSLEEARSIFDSLSDRNVVAWTAMIAGYAQCGRVDEARCMFDKLPFKDVVTWNTMLGGYVQRGMVQDAFSLYSRMQHEGLVRPDSSTFVCLLQACAIVAGLPLGKRLHAQIEEQGMQSDVVVGAALVNMYAKCGSMFDCQKVFNSLPQRTVEAWGALIGGYSRLGDSVVVFDLVDRMTLDGVQPTDVVLLNVLTVCSHVGLVNEGRKYFEEMKTVYDITPTIEHYTCILDLLSRAGHLEEALRMAMNMPFPPDYAVWITLLGACRKWHNVEIGRQAFKFAVQLDEKGAASYVLMYNIYARARMWEEAKEMQARRLKFGAWKEPGQSWWTDMEGVVHTFVAGDFTHPEKEGIHARLDKLVPKLRVEGYVPHLESSLSDISDYAKEVQLCGHSEKLATAYALNKTAEGTTIRVVKNLRVCEDCHIVIGYISKVEKRTIICRDSNRFHVFKEGKCSCGDYW